MCSSPKQSSQQLMGLSRKRGPKKVVVSETKLIERNQITSTNNDIHEEQVGNFSDELEISKKFTTKNFVKSLLWSNQPKKFSYIDGLILIFSLVTLFLQHSFIYRSNYANYNGACLCLSVAMVTRHFWMISPTNYLSNKPLRIIIEILRVIIFGLGCYSAYLLYLRNPLVNFLFLLYPIIFRNLFWKNSRCKYEHDDQKSCQTGKCIISQLEIVIFDTIEISYFAAFIPLRFVESKSLYYDPRHSYVLLGYSFCLTFVLEILQLLSAHALLLYLQTLKMKSQFLSINRSGQQQQQQQQKQKPQQIQVTTHEHEKETSNSHISDSHQLIAHSTSEISVLPTTIPGATVTPVMVHSTSAYNIQNPLAYFPKQYVTSTVSSYELPPSFGQSIVQNFETKTTTTDELDTTNTKDFHQHP
eukprot:c17958_g1_i3.p1 GENE.c17958_g1_i3~~c17958_g1_i3.p1  ORF type:complete len:415 (+),score=92.74 c17958_g1_i3:135-1379(+)